jgi:hypothetical protein
MGQSERVDKLYEEPTILLVGTNRLSDRLYETLQTSGMDVERVSAAVAPAAYRAVVPDLCVIAADGLDERGKQAVIKLFDGRSRSISPPVLIEKNSQGLTSQLKSSVIATLSPAQPMIALAKHICNLAVKASETREQLVQQALPPELPVVSPTLQTIDSTVPLLDLEEETEIFDEPSRERRPRIEGSQPLEYQAFKQTQSDGNLDAPKSIELDPDELELFEFESRIRTRGLRYRLTSLLALIVVGLNRMRILFKTRTFENEDSYTVSTNKRFDTVFRRFLNGTKAELVGILDRTRDYLRNHQDARQNASRFIKEFASQAHAQVVLPLGTRLGRLVDSGTLRFKMLSRSNKILIYATTASIAVGTFVIVLAVDNSSVETDPGQQEQSGQSVNKSSLIGNEAETVPSRKKTRSSFGESDNRKRGSAAKARVSKVFKESTGIESEDRSQSRPIASSSQRRATKPAARRRGIISGRGSKSGGRVTQIAKAYGFIRKGNRMLRVNRLGIAESYYLKALRAKPRYPRAMASLVKVHLRRKDGREALRWAKRLIKRQPNKPANQRLLKRALAINKIEKSKAKKKNSGSATRRRKTRSSRRSQNKRK